VSEHVALRLPLPDAVVTWFVTGFPDRGRTTPSAGEGPAGSRDAR
jgi:hypothetical protein